MIGKVERTTTSESEETDVTTACSETRLHTAFTWWEGGARAVKKSPACSPPTGWPHGCHLEPLETGGR